MARQRKIEGREQIAAAALDIIDAEGLATLTMRRVGRALGVEAMTLYGYVRNRDALLDAVHALLLAGIEPPSASPDWIDDAVVLARRLRAKLMAHPNAVPIVATRPATELASLDLLETCLGVIPSTLTPAGAAADIVQTVFVFVVGHCSFHAALATRDPNAPTIDVKRHALLSQLPPSSAEDEFEAGLQILAAGLRSRYAEGSARTS